VLPRLDREAVAAEIEVLGPEHELDENRDFRVYVAQAASVPRAMLEIGRQRELAFREAGEGTGKQIDLDCFDIHYQHLILWHRKDRQIAGGYRFASSADVLPHRGLAGPHTNTLFWIDPTFFERTGPALELGRSFVRREYQKQYAPLLTLWKGLRPVSLHASANPGAVRAGEHLERLPAPLARAAGPVFSQPAHQPSLGVAPAASPVPLHSPSRLADARHPLFARSRGDVVLDRRNRR
jgi:hypothetical protein